MDNPRLTIEIDKKLRQEFKVKTMQEGKTMRDKLIEWIKNYIKRG